MSTLPPPRPTGDSKPSHLKDLALARRAVAGSPSAWMDLVQRHQGLVHGLLVRHVRPQEREDLFQDIFLRIHKGLARYEGSAALGTWIFQIGLNVVRSHWEARTRLRQREVLATDHLVPDEAGEAPAWDVPVLPDQDDALETRMAEDRAARLRTEIRRMRPLDRQVLLLRDVEGCAYDEIADRLNLALGTVKSRLARARAHLAELLKGDRP
jgi:RNA polymerase sigma-70 factor (ECF subfamily)